MLPTQISHKGLQMNRNNDVQSNTWRPTGSGSGSGSGSGNGPVNGRRNNSGAEPDGGDGQGGQATAEYALVMLAAAGLAGSVLAWAVSTDAAGRLMDAVLDSVIGQVT